METIHFRYNRLSHHTLYLMLIVAFLAGIGLIRLVFIDWLKMDRGRVPRYSKSTRIWPYGRSSGLFPLAPFRSAMQPTACGGAEMPRDA